MGKDRLFKLFPRRPKSAASSRATSPGASQSAPTAPAEAAVATQQQLNQPTKPSVGARLWQRAYEELQKQEPDHIQAYERILSGLGTTVSNPQDMQRLIDDGLARTERHVQAKDKASQWLSCVTFLKDVMGNAVRAVPSGAVTWVGVTMGLEIITNPLSEPGINRQGLAYILMRMEWYWKLSELLLQQNQGPTANSDLRTTLEDEICLLYQKLILYQIRSVCLYNKNQATVFLRDVVKKDDWAAQLEGIKSMEEVIRTDSEKYSTEHAKRTLSGIEATAVNQLAGLGAIEHAVQDQTRRHEQRHENERDAKCRRDLYVTDPRKDKERIEYTKGGLIETSYKWILEHHSYQDFILDPNAHLFWIRGDPGKGKTMLLCGIIDQLESRSHELAYFFCQATLPQLRTSTNVLRGLLFGLVQHQPYLLSYIRPAYDDEGKALFEGVNAWFSLRTIISNMLDGLGNWRPVIVIDALDECTEGRDDLIQLIIDLSRKGNAKWIISSRNWPEIKEQLGDVEGLRSVRLELNHDVISEAVQSFIRVKVDELSAKKNYDSHVKQLVYQELSKKADDTFLWVALVCHSLAQPRVRAWDVIKKLEAIPPGLEPFYQRMMDAIIESEGSELIKQILSTACSAFRPLQKAEMKTLVEELDSVGDGYLEEIIESCGSFLTVRNEFVYFVHQSAKDFLLKSPQQGEQISRHAMIFSRSIASLNVLRRDIYGLNEPGVLTEEIEVPNPDPLAPVAYSCTYWVHHLLEVGDETTEMLDSCESFLKQGLLNWLEALSLLKCLPFVTAALVKLSKELVSTHVAAWRLYHRLANKSWKLTPEDSLKDLLHDILRFVFAHMKTMEEAPLQIYISALVFSPSQSIVRRLYSDEEPSWITFRPRQSAMWDACLYTTEYVLCVALSPITSAEQFATVSGGNQIIIWDLNSPTRTKTINTTLILQCLAYSVDGRQLVSFGLESDQTGTVLVWDISTWSCVKVIPGVPVLSSLFTLADGDIAGIEMVYRKRSGRIPWLVMQSHDAIQPPRSRPLMDVEVPEFGDLWVEFAPHRRLLACSTGSSISIQRIDAEERNPAALPEAESVAAIAFSSDEMSLFSASTEGSVCVWNLGNLDNIFSRDFAKASGGIVDMECSSNGEFLATVSLQDTICLWSIATGECVRRVHAQGASISSLAISPTGRHAVSRGLWDRAKVWDMTLNHGADHSAQEAQTDRNELCVSPDGQMVVFPRGHSVEIWHTALHARIHCLDTSSIGDFSPDSRYYAVNDHDGREWRTVIQTINGAQHVIDANWPTTTWSIVWCADAVDGPLLARTTRDQRIGIWRPARTSDPQFIAPRGKDSRLRPLGFSPGGKWLITISSSGLQMWDVDTGRFECGVESANSVAISHNHDRLVVNKGLGIAIWDLAKQKDGTGIVLSRTIDLQLYPEAIAISPIGDIVVCTGYDYIVSTKEDRHSLAVVNLNTVSTLTKTFVGPYEYIEPSFDDSGMTLRTSLGLIDMRKVIAKWKVEETAMTEDIAEDFYQATTRYNLDQTRQWVFKGRSRALRLPPDYADASKMKGTFWKVHKIFVFDVGGVLTWFQFE